MQTDLLAIVAVKFDGSRVANRESATAVKGLRWRLSALATALNYCCMGLLLIQPEQKIKNMSLKEKDEALAEARKSLARLREKRNDVLSDFQRQGVDIRQEYREKLTDLGRRRRKRLDEIDAEIATVQDVIHRRG